MPVFIEFNNSGTKINIEHIVRVEVRLPLAQHAINVGPAVYVVDVLGQEHLAVATKPGTSVEEATAHRDQIIQTIQDQK